jgi:hypothetical protein
MAKRLNNMRKTLIFSIAVNGYHIQYQANLKSLVAYADRMGFSRVIVTQPKFSPMGLEVVWLKLRLVLAALQAGYDWVIYVDADAAVRATAPNILADIDRRNAFFAAKGYSGRINSGVLVFRRCSESIRLLETILQHREMCLPAQDDVGWGENGHVIHFSREFPLLEILDPRWNNNSDPDLDDYIRHYSAGPMRAHFKVSRSAHLGYLCYHYVLAVYARLAHWGPASVTLGPQLDALTASTLHKYPLFLKP